MLQQYRLTAKPVGKLQDKVDLAVDSIVQLTLGEGMLGCKLSCACLVPCLDQDIHRLFITSFKGNTLCSAAY